MKTFTALLTLCEGKPLVTDGFHPQKPVTRRFDVFFDLRLNERLGKQLWRRWFETPYHSLWRHCNIYGFLWQSSGIPIYDMKWEFMKATGEFVPSNEAGVQRVRDSNGRYAFLVESGTIDYINERKPCDTMKVGDLLNSYGYGIGLALGSELRLVCLTETLLIHLGVGSAPMNIIYIYIYISQDKHHSYVTRYSLCKPRYF